MAVATHEGIERIEELLGDEAESLLGHTCQTIDKDLLHLPGPDFVDRVVAINDRSNQVLRNLQSMFEHGRLGGTGYLSILPVDQGIEHSAGASFAPNPMYFDPEKIVELAIEGGCNAVASTFGVLGAVARQVRAQDPVHRQAQPQRAADLPEQVRPGHVRERRAGVGDGRGRRRRDDLLRQRARARARSSRSAQAFAEAHELGMVTVLWCYLRNPAFKTDDGLPRRGRPDRAGQSPRRDDRGRHHQAEAAREQRRQRAERRTVSTARRTDASTPS